MQQATGMTRRQALAGLMASTGAMVPITAQSAGLSESDRQIIAAAHDLRRVDAEISRLGDICERRYNADPERTPLAERHAALNARSVVLLDMLAETPAESVQAVAAKLSATRRFRCADPGLGYDRVEWAALYEIERLGGVT